MRIRNHWAPPFGQLGYYWFLTFEKIPELHSHVTECQASIDFPYYDLVPLDRLHLTLDRIAPAQDLARDQIDSIETSIKRACEHLPPFHIEINRLNGVGSAVAFNVQPAQSVHDLRDTLRSATTAACPGISLKPPKTSPPHITIAYANSDDVSAADAMTAIDKVNATVRRVEIKVDEAVMVLLDREQRAYSWQVVSRVPLGGLAGR
ncbi:2'-5' RNA ligase family protein [Nocardia alni]|uniref:2'-5' RNA ligase family protein n=1 Tax=Nocardia alni TaxID=2815723 RepID=UPI001C22FA62|nr:2'-5' RNA ligase family protein [Nocardia alni]